MNRSFRRHPPYIMPGCDYDRNQNRLDYPRSKSYTVVYMARAKGPDLAARLTWIRAASGLSAGALSDMAGLTRSHVALIESGAKKNIHMKTARCIAEVLGISWSWLLSGEGEPPTEMQIQKAVRSRAA